MIYHVRDSFELIARTRPRSFDHVITSPGVFGTAALPRELFDVASCTTAIIGDHTDLCLLRDQLEGRNARSCLIRHLGHFTSHEALTWFSRKTRVEELELHAPDDLSLFLRIVASISGRGETIFDPFACAAIGRACKLIDRAYSGFNDCIRDTDIRTMNADIDAPFVPVTEEDAVMRCTPKEET